MRTFRKTQTSEETPDHSDPVAAQTRHEHAFHDIVPATTQVLGVVSALALATIHLIEMPEDFEEMPYLGVLFGIGSVLLIVSAVGLIRRPSSGAAWAVGALSAGGMLAGYWISRTVGLPGMEREAWGEPLGVLSLILEVVFLAAAVTAFVARSPSPGNTPTGAAATT